MKTISPEQIGNKLENGKILWSFECPHNNDCMNITIDHIKKSIRFERVFWDEIKEDWDGEKIDRKTAYNMMNWKKLPELCS